MPKPVILFWTLLSLWAAAYAASLWALFVLDPTGDGFTRGLNRLTAFVGWQSLAALIAVVLWLVARKWATGAQRWLARIPGILAILLILLIVGSMLWARLSHPEPGPTLPPKPATQPVDQ